MKPEQNLKFIRKLAWQIYQKKLANVAGLGEPIEFTTKTRWIKDATEEAKMFLQITDEPTAPAAEPERATSRMAGPLFIGQVWKSENGHIYEITNIHVRPGKVEIFYATSVFEGGTQATSMKRVTDFRAMLVKYNCTLVQGSLTPTAPTQEDRLTCSLFSGQKWKSANGSIYEITGIRTNSADNIEIFYATSVFEGGVQVTALRPLSAFRQLLIAYDCTEVKK